MTMRDTFENRAELRKRLQAIREELGELAMELDTVDHDAAREIHSARNSLHDAWKILRELPRSN